MAEYRTLVTCFHNGSRYRAGQVATFPDGEAVPHHFERIEAEAPAEAEAVDEESADEENGEDEAEAENSAPATAGKKGRRK